MPHSLLRLTAIALATTASLVAPPMAAAWVGSVADEVAIRVGSRLAADWLSSHFRIRDHRRYGFSSPFDGGYWIRHYDDAVLIDEHGRVHDVRRGLDWDRYGDRWRYDRGVPEYVGEGDYYPDSRDHAWVEANRDGYRGGYPPPPMHYPQAIAPGPYRPAPFMMPGQPQGQYGPYAGLCATAIYGQPPAQTVPCPGYVFPGYYQPQPIIVTETTVTTTITRAPQVTYQYVSE